LLQAEEHIRQLQSILNIVIVGIMVLERLQKAERPEFEPLLASFL